MEPVDLYNEDRLPLGKTADRHGPKAPGEYRMVVHVCVFNSQGRLLAQRRAPEKTTFSGLWDVSASGGVDAGETSRQGAEREVREELGITLDLAGIRPSVTVNFPGGFDDFYVVTRDVGPEELKLQKDEVSEVSWITLEDALTMREDGRFIPYPPSFLVFLFEARGTFDF